MTGLVLLCNIAGRIVGPNFGFSVCCPLRLEFQESASACRATQAISSFLHPALLSLCLRHELHSLCLPWKQHHRLPYTLDRSNMERQWNRNVALDRSVCEPRPSTSKCPQSVPENGAGVWGSVRRGVSGAQGPTGPGDTPPDTPPGQPPLVFGDAFGDTLGDTPGTLRPQIQSLKGREAFR